MSQTKTYRNGSLRVELDKSQVFPNDPGQGTPAMVCFDGARDRYASTYWCAVGEGELLHERTGATKQLTDKQMEWLDGLEPEISEFLYGE